MKRSDWLGGLRTTLGFAPHRRVLRVKRRVPALRRATFELLEDRRLLAVDFGDAPDTALGTGPGNYNTLSTDNGAQHTIVVGLRMGANVDGDGGALQNAAANADDVNGALPDDEDGLLNPGADLVLTVGAQPTINVRVTNTTGAAATLYGWIDVNANGVFDNATERASIAVPNGTNNLIKTLTFSAVPTGFTGTTYARFRLSTDASAANPTGAAADGEVEDYRVTISSPSSGLADSAKTKKIASGTSGGPTLVNSDYFGRSVATIGDIDGDGVADLAIGASGNDIGGNGRGAIYVARMNSNGSVKSLSQITGSSRGSSNGDYFGISLAPVGDLDGDGISDLIVGAEKSDDGGAVGSNRGSAYVVFLNSDGSPKGSRRIYNFSFPSTTPLSDGDYFGHSVAAVGDLDGDGVTDLAVGAYGDNTGGADRGAVYLLFINGDGSIKSHQKVASGLGGGPTLANSDKFGSSITSVGDLDGDGITDLAVGAIYDDTGGTNRGAVHVLFMNSNGTVKGTQKIASGVGGGPALTNGDQFGASLAAVGDLDGDGVTDLAVGANYDDTGGTSRGAIHVLFMNANGTVKASHKIASGTNGGPTLANDDRFGVSIASMGDLDGDGRSDLAVGANFDDTGGTNRGAVYTLFLSGLVNTNPVFTSSNTANVPENTMAVMTVTATDAEAPPQTVTFSLVGGADQSKFSITSGGVLSFNSAPDFEVPTDANGDNVYVVEVQASDGAGGTALQTINVTVTGVNESPVITSPNSVNVPENSTAVMTVTATDPDLPTQTGVVITSESVVTPGLAGYRTYTLTATSSIAGEFISVIDFIGDAAKSDPNDPDVKGFFGAMNHIRPINMDTVFNNLNGFFAPADPLADSQFRYSTVSADAVNSPAGFFSESPTSLRALFGRDVPLGQSAQFAQIVIPDSTTGTVTYRGSFSVTRGGTIVDGGNVSGTVGVDAVTFSIVGGADQAKFGISSSGVLTFNSAPDFEVPTDSNGDNVYVVTVQASDGIGGTTQQTINVTVTPTNDNNPVFTSPNTVSVAENSTTVMNVTATDADLPAQAVSFLLVGGADQSKFSISGGGALRFVMPPKFTTPTDANGDNVYVVTVQASDGNGGTTMQTINVSVTSLSDFGDAPDSAAGTGPGNYNTRLSDSGPSHLIVTGLRMGASVDANNGTLQNAAANADDVNGALPDDEDGLTNPAADLVLTVGAQPTVNIRVTNTTGAAATLYGWIDVNSNGVFDNATERASIAVPSGTNNLIKTLTFPAVPVGFTGTTYARFRLSSDPAAANPTGAAIGGEVEDYQVAVTKPSSGRPDSTKTQKIASGIGGGPTLANSDSFGNTVASLGDLNGDGVIDLAVGAQSTSLAGGTGGSLYVLFMNPNGSVQSSQKIGSGIGGGPILANGDYFGRSVAALGDLDGDGIVELAVGADRDNTGGSLRGAVYVLFMNANGTVKGSQKIAHNVGGGPTLANTDRFGGSVTALGDLDGDGVTDLAVGASGDDTGGTNRGAAYVLLLNSNGTVKSSQKIASGVGGGPIQVNSDYFGGAVASTGDIDGDGVTDLAVGAWGDDSGGSGRGAVYVLFLNANGTVKGSQKIAEGVGGGPALSDFDFFGSSLAALGDLDGDGVTDLAAGARYDDTGGTDRGAFYVMLLNADGTTKGIQKIASNTAGGPSLANGDIFGRSIAALGDLNGDGLTDLAVGAERDDTGGTERGAAYVLFLKKFNLPPIIVSSATANVAENTTAVMTATGTDVDVPAQTLTFSIVGGSDQTKFGITSGGVLSFNLAPDFEAPTDANLDNVYVVAIQVDDGEGGTATQTINVSVAPVNDNSPVFTSADSANVAENTTAVVTVTATDADVPSQTVTFSIVGGADQAKFAMTSGGVLSFKAAPDFEAPADTNGDNIYVLIVQASDGGLTRLQAILVMVTDLFEGDYNSDGTVDAADYTVWRNNVGNIVPAFSNPDGSGNGIVDQDDYKVWKSNFGNTQLTGSGASEAIVPSAPEPDLELPKLAESESSAATQSAETVDDTVPTPLAPSVFVVQRARSLGVNFRPGKRDLPVIAASRDQALVAWLATRPTEPRHERPAASFERSPSEPDVCDSSERFVDMLDRAFDLLGT